MARIVTIASQKGGVGKSTATGHIGVALASLNLRVLLMDWDTTQGNLTRTFLGPIWEREERIPGICELVDKDEPHRMREIIQPTRTKGLWIVPSEKENARGNAYNSEGTLTLNPGGLGFVKAMLDDDTLHKDFDIILIDTPPSLGISLVSAMFASDYVLSPINTSDFSMEAIVDTIKAIVKVKRSNKLLHPLGFFISKLDGRSINAKESISELQTLSESSGIYFFKNMIPTSVRFDSLPREMKTYFDVAPPSNKINKSYMNLAKEIISQINIVEKGDNKQQSEKTEDRAGV